MDRNSSEPTMSELQAELDIAIRSAQQWEAEAMLQMRNVADIDKKLADSQAACMMHFEHNQKLRAELRREAEVQSAEVERLKSGVHEWFDAYKRSQIELAQANAEVERAAVELNRLNDVLRSERARLATLEADNNAVHEKLVDVAIENADLRALLREASETLHLDYYSSMAEDVANRIDAALQ